MTIVTETCRETYAGNGVSPSFPVPFPFFDVTELDVQIVQVSDGTAQPLYIGSGYTVTGGAGNTGTVITTTVVPGGSQLLIRRKTNRTQLTDLVANDDLPAQTLELSLDRLAAQSAETAEQLGRTLRAPTQEASVAPLPPVRARANALAAYDGTGQPYALPITALSFAVPGIPSIGDLANVKSPAWGARGDGVTDDTAAIQAAIDALGTYGGLLYLPQGTYQISKPLILGQYNIRLLGSGAAAAVGGTIIRSSALDQDILRISGPNCSVSNIGFDYTGTPTSGSAIFVTGSNTILDNFYIQKAFNGVTFTTGAGQFAHHFQIFNYVNTGIQCYRINDVYCDSFILNAGDISHGILGGIRLQEQVEAFVATNGDVLLGRYSLLTDATYPGVGSRPAYCKFHNVFFDSSANGTQLNNCAIFTFTDCWFSAGRFLSGADGCLLINTESIRFVNTEFFNCGLNGCRVSYLAKRTIFVACIFESNAYSAGSTYGHGLFFDLNTTDFVVQNCIAFNGTFTNVQGFGILINTGSSDRYVVANNLLSGNGTAGLSDGGSGTNKIVSGNLV